MPRKKNQAFGLGSTLIKNRFGNKKGLSAHKFAAELEENDEGGMLVNNLKSVVELDDMDDFLATAELAGTDFTAAKLNVRYMDRDQAGLQPVERSQFTQLQMEINNMLSVPRRPKWDETTTKEELDTAERECFLTWRRHLAGVQEELEVELTPYEKNLDFWRQLWRVVERSDVIVQIVDARDPLLYRCLDFEGYVKEVGPNKKNIILVNKADFLSIEQRQIWRAYWDEQGVTAVFWSALLENEKLDAKKDEEEEDEVKIEPVEDVVEEDVATRLLTREELIDYFKAMRSEGQDRIVIGMVGYPNVGKSSTVNTLMGEKRVAVSATPGRTKHFQTLNIDEHLCLCDCPGLVFPSYISNTAEMVLCGILPIDQMRDYVAPINLLASRISRSLLNCFYGLRIALPKEHDPDQSRPPTSNELLDAHALSRGFMTSHGQPDNARSSRIVLKDYVNGKLVWSKPPPQVGTPDADSDTKYIADYRSTTPMLSEVRSIVDESKYRQTQHLMAAEKSKKHEEAAEEAQFDVEISTFVVGSHRAAHSDRPGSTDQPGGKKKHFKKKEKMRRRRTVQY